MGGIGQVVSRRAAVASLGMLLVTGGCSQEAAESSQVTQLRRLPVDTVTGVLTQSGVAFDPEISADGKGSLRITATTPPTSTTVRLYELGDMDIEHARLIYQAKLRTEDVKGKVYLEMWCSFPGRGEFFSRGLATALTGTTEWTSQETLFLLKKGENPDNVKLNVVVEGTGTQCQNLRCDWFTFGPDNSTTGPLTAPGSNHCRRG